MSIAGSIPGQSSHLVDLRLFRRADGTIEAVLVDMPPRLIETTGAGVPERMRIVADWVAQGAGDLLRQAHTFAITGPANDA